MATRRSANFTSIENKLSNSTAEKFSGRARSNDGQANYHISKKVSRRPFFQWFTGRLTQKFDQPFLTGPDYIALNSVKERKNSANLNAISGRFLKKF